MNKLDLLSIGDASLDVFITPTESEALCQLNDKESLLCFSYGDKIPVKNLEFSIGGNAANNAVGTKRLGIASATLLTLGDDDIGSQIVEKLTKENINTSFVHRQEGIGSNYSVAISFSGERTLFTYKSAVVYKFPEELPEVSWIYLTSVGDEFQKVYGETVAWVKTKSIKMAFNPGSRQIRAGFDALKDTLAATYVVYVNRSEAETIASFGNSVNKEKELLAALTKMGPKIAVITDGGNGVYVHSGETFYKANVLPVDPFERTGAGDAFGSGFLSAIIKGKNVEEAIVWGTVNSASVIGYTGAQKGLLKEDEIGVWLERAKSSNVKVEEF